MLKEHLDAPLADSIQASWSDACHLLAKHMRMQQVVREARPLTLNLDLLNGCTEDFQFKGQVCQIVQSALG